ncbi:MAG: glycosyltransferase family 4 protein [Betaproteobacteria bacterium]
MRLLVVHQNFPGQYKNLLARLAASGKHEIVFLTQREQGSIEGVRKIRYSPGRKISDKTHHYLRTTEAAVVNAQAVWRAASQLRKSGFYPDLILGHNGWGETLFLKDVFPDAPLLSYFEFFYRPSGSDIDFDPEYPATVDTRLRSQVLNAVNLMGLECADWGQAPTIWQRDQFPQHHRDRISIVHEGIDTDVVKPDAQAFVQLQSRLRLRFGDEVITYVARNLEPYRGFHIFMRALPELLRRRPKAHVLVLGADDVSYGMHLPPGETFRQKLLAEVGGKLDMSRVHFLGQVPHALFLKILQVSAAHIYLTYPFVLSWSMLEAMSAGCLVIGSNTAPVTEFMRHGENGLLVDFFSPGEIGEAVDFAMANPEQIATLREKARRTVIDRCDFETVCFPRQMQLIEDLLASRHTAVARQSLDDGAHNRVSTAKVDAAPTAVSSTRRGRSLARH